MITEKQIAEEFINDFSKKIQSCWIENMPKDQKANEVDLIGSYATSAVVQIYEHFNRKQLDLWLRRYVAKPEIELLDKLALGKLISSTTELSRIESALKKDPKATFDQELSTIFKDTDKDKEKLISIAHEYLTKGVPFAKKDALKDYLENQNPALEKASADSPSGASNSANVRNQYEPTDTDYKEINSQLKNSDVLLCSLIYSYWIDEGGLLWAVERLADRVENGVSHNTRPLLSVRIEETGNLPYVLNRYSHSWERGELAAVDERRRQYLAIYGFPLYSAVRWGPLETVDPNQGFAAAFHEFLASAMRFYRDSRNTQIVPDEKEPIKAFDRLNKCLREYNENLRRVRPVEFRAQVEYAKQVLGGMKSQSATNPPLNPVANDWKSASLPGRPGSRASMDPWEFAVDTVANLYQWRRPSISEYLTLAENGELLLIITRIFSDAIDQLTGKEMWALLALLENCISKYVNSYKIVSGVDLASPNPFLGAPALAMAKHLQPLTIPPLRRKATELPRNNGD